MQLVVLLAHINNLVIIEYILNKYYFDLKVELWKRTLKVDFLT